MAMGNSAMILETGAAWTRGLNNVLRAEFGRWFRSRMWWIQILIWTTMLNGFLLVVVFSTPDEAREVGPMIFSALLGIGGPIGVSIIMQDVLAGEKRSGTAAWVLSKPLSRAAFVVAKLVANVVGVAVTMVLVPGVISYLIMTFVAHVELPLAGYAAALGVHLVNLLFYLTVTLMLGAIFNSSAVVIGIPLAFLFFQQWLPNLWAPLAKVIPFSLTMPTGDAESSSIAAALMAGVRPETFLPLIATLAASVVFVAVALWGFQRQEL
jgi:ABC-2 type transport system permease protein